MGTGAASTQYLQRTLLITLSNVSLLAANRIGVQNASSLPMTSGTPSLHHFETLTTPLRRYTSLLMATRQRRSPRMAYDQLTRFG